MRWFFIVFAFLVIATVIGLRPRGGKFSKPPFELFNDMDRQFKVKYQKPSQYFEDGSGSRKPVEGTMPLGFVFPISKEGGIPTTDLDFAVGDDYYNTGYIGSNYGQGFPSELTVDKDLLERGQERYQIFCSPCHGDTGNGKGVVSKFWGAGAPQPPVRKAEQTNAQYEEAQKAYLKEAKEFYGLTPLANLVDARAKGLPEGRIYHTIVHGNGGLMGGYGGVIPLKDRWAIVAYVKALQAAN